ncbi:unnamed protein product [Musa acuminata subsp. burmannicoides]
MLLLHSLLWNGTIIKLPKYIGGKCLLYLIFAQPWVCI